MNLEGKALDWAVASALGYTDWDGECFCTAPDGAPIALFLADFNPSTEWAQGGPIIEREKITVQRLFFSDGGFYAHWWDDRAYSQDEAEERGKYHMVYGQEYLVAAMRCFVATKLGEEIEIPQELL